MPESSPPDLLNCSADALGSFLYESRFEEKADDTAKFLRAAADRVIAKSLVKIEDAIDIGDSLHTDITISSLQPRGKLQLTIGSHGVRMGLDEAVAGFMLRPNTVKACFVFPKPEECRKSKSTASDIVVFSLSEEITFKGKKHSQLCFQLPPRPKATDDEAGVTEDHTSKWMVLFQRALNFGDYERVYHPKNQDYGNLNSFQSYSDNQVSSTTAGMPYVSCYHTVHDGVVFPMNSAFLFYKPIRMFLLDDLSVRVESTSSRYIGITFEGDDEERVTLSNISAHERTGLEHFLAENGKSGDAVEPDESSTDESPLESTRSSRKRKAAKQASTINKRMVWEADDDEPEEEDVTFDIDQTDDDGADEDGNSTSNEVEGETDEDETSAQPSSDEGDEDE